jgi:hypothetical protein
MGDQSNWAPDLATFNRKYQHELKGTISVRYIGACIGEYWMDGLRIGTFNPYSDPILDVNGHIPARLKEEFEHVSRIEHKKQLKRERRQLGFE